MSSTPNQGQSSIVTGKVCLHGDTDPFVRHAFTGLLPQAGTAPRARRERQGKHTEPPNSGSRYLSSDICPERRSATGTSMCTCASTARFQAVETCDWGKAPWMAGSLGKTGCAQWSGKHFLALLSRKLHSEAELRKEYSGETGRYKGRGSREGVAFSNKGKPAGRQECRKRLGKRGRRCGPASCNCRDASLGWFCPWANTAASTHTPGGDGPLPTLAVWSSLWL